MRIPLAVERSDSSTQLISRAKRAVFVLGVLVVGGLCVETLPLSGAPTWAGPSSGSGMVKKQGDAERGRAVFNGKGICSYCHGIDGYKDRRPPLTPNTLEAIARLDPKPADLRNPGSLKLTTDKERFDAIRDGHILTAMYPDRTLTDQEIFDAVAYLATLRGETAARRQP